MQHKCCLPSILNQSGRFTRQVSEGQGLIPSCCESGIARRHLRCRAQNRRAEMRFRQIETKFQSNFRTMKKAAAVIWPGDGAQSRGSISSLILLWLLYLLTVAQVCAFTSTASPPSRSLTEHLFAHTHIQALRVIKPAAGIINFLNVFIAV